MEPVKKKTTLYLSRKEIQYFFTLLLMFSLKYTHGAMSERGVPLSAGRAGLKPATFQSKLLRPFECAAESGEIHPNLFRTSTCEGDVKPRVLPSSQEQCRFSESYGAASTATEEDSQTWPRTRGPSNLDPRFRKLRQALGSVSV